MGHFVERRIEEYDDGSWTKTVDGKEQPMSIYFIHGIDPPKILIDDIEGCYYELFGMNSWKEHMYFKRKLN